MVLFSSLAERRNQSQVVGWRGEQTKMSYEGRLSSDGTGCSFSLSHIKSVSKLYKVGCNNKSSPSLVDDGGGIENNHGNEPNMHEWTPVENLATSKVGEQVDLREEIVKNKNKYPDYPQFNENHILQDKLENILNPATATFEDIKRALISHPRLTLKESKDPKNKSTLGKTLDMLKKFEEHPICPVDLKNPSPLAFRRYLDSAEEHGDWNSHRTKIVSIGVNGRNDRIKVWTRFCTILGVEKIWDIPIMHKVEERVHPMYVPLPEDVNAVLHFDYFEKRSMEKYKGFRRREINNYLQYLLFFGFVTGVAPEVEWIHLDYNDVTFDSRGRCNIIVKRPKVGKKSRRITLETRFSKSNNAKSMYALKHNIRERFARENECALLVDPATGRRWEIASLRRFLEKATLSKSLREQINIPPKENFIPYTTRHWDAIARMIDWGKNESALAMVNHWLGHDKDNIGQTMKYLDVARLFDDDCGSWLDRAFKRRLRTEDSKNPAGTVNRQKSMPLYQTLEESKTDLRGVAFSYRRASVQWHPQIKGHRSQGIYLFLFFFLIIGGVIKRISIILYNWQSGVELRPEGMI